MRKIVLFIVATCLLSAIIAVETDTIVRKAKALSALKELLADQYHYSAYENEHGCGVHYEDLLDICNNQMHPNLCFLGFKAVCLNAPRLCNVSKNELGTYCKLVEKQHQGFCNEHIQALYSKKCAGRSTLADLLEKL